MLNIRVYRIQLPDGSSFFVNSAEDRAGGVRSESISVIAKQCLYAGMIDKKEQDIKQVSNPTQSTIDFKPFHDIECPVGSKPQRCFPLTEKEQNDFWVAFCLV